MSGSPSWRRALVVGAIAAGLAGASLGVRRPAGAQTPPPGGPTRSHEGAGPHAMPPGRPGGALAPRLPPGHVPTGGPHAGPAGHEQREGQSEGHEGHAQPINWAYGLLSEKEGLSEPNLLFRPKGMPAPFLASLINFALLLGAAFVFGRKPLAAALRKRRETVMHDIDEATKVRDEAKQRRDLYKQKLAQVQDDVGRIRAESATQAERDRERILREAEEKRTRLRRDAEFLLEQERKAARQTLLARVAEAASSRAEELLRTRASAADQERLADEYLRAVAGAAQREAA